MKNDEEIDFLIRKKMIEIQKKAAIESRRRSMTIGVLEVNSKEFRNYLTRYRIVVADFWAEWCIPCRIVSPIIERLARRYSGSAVFLKVNVDENHELAVEHGILSIPTVIVFVNGKEYERFIGAFPGIEKKLSITIEKLINQ